MTSCMCANACVQIFLVSAVAKIGATLATYPMLVVKVRAREGEGVRGWEVIPAARTAQCLLLPFHSPGRRSGVAAIRYCQEPLTSFLWNGRFVFSHGHHPCPCLHASTSLDLS